MKRQKIGVLLGVLWLLALAGGAAAAEGRVAAGQRAGDEERAAAAQGTEAAKGKAAGKGAAAGLVNVNEATPEQLALLPGIGPSRAKAIADHRKAHPFKRVEELTRIKGIGKKTFAKLRPHVALSGPTTLSERPPRR